MTKGAGTLLIQFDRSSGKGFGVDLGACLYAVMMEALWYIEKDGIYDVWDKLIEARDRKSVV